MRAVCLLLLLAGQALGFTKDGTIYTTDGTSADAQAAINDASTGDIVDIPIPSHTWTAAITCNKAIHIRGAGAGRVLAWSRVSNTFGTGTKTFTIQTGATIANGTTLRVWRTATDPGGTYMLGTVSSYNSGTGALEMDIVTNTADGPDVFTAATDDIITSAAHGLASGDQLRVTTTGTLPGGLATGTDYYVLASGLTTDDFKVSTTSGGGAVNITSTGTGTHTWHRSAPQWLAATEYSTRIIHNIAAGGALFELTESTAGSVEISGIKFHPGTGRDYIKMIYTSGGEPILIHDCFFLNGTGTCKMIETSTTNRGVIYKSSVVFDAWAESNAQWLHWKPISRTEVWAALSTMGAADTTGKNNLYVEDNDFHGMLNACDIDDNGKVVWRYNIMNHASAGGHGYDTSAYGSRHWEFYNNTCLFASINGSGNTLSQMQYYFRQRGGTGVITDNSFQDISSSAGGAKPEIGFGVYALGLWVTSPGHWSGNDAQVPEYPCPRQVGFGRVTGTGVDGKGNSTSGGVYVGDTEPIYIWSNTGFTPEIQITTDTAAAAEQGVTPDNPNDYVQLNRDYFFSADATAAKPSYVKYVYPHPLRTAAAETPAKILIQ